MEEGHDQKRGLLRLKVRIGIGQGLARHQERAGVGDAARADVGAARPVAGHGALGLSGGARGVENSRRILGLQGDVGQCQVGERRPVAYLADHLFQPAHLGMGDLFVVARDIDEFEVRAAVDVFGDALEPFGIDDGDARAGVGQAVMQLRPRPPGIHRRDDRPGDQRGEKDHGPFGQVAHDQRHPVPLFDAPRDEFVGQGKGRLAERRIGRPLVLIDHKFAVGIGQADLEQTPESRRRVLPGAHGPPLDDLVFHLELDAGSGQQRMRVFAAHHGPARRQWGGFGHGTRLTSLARPCRKAERFPALIPVLFRNRGRLDHL